MSSQWIPGISNGQVLQMGGSLLGGIAGAAGSGSGGGQSQTASKEPWAAAAPWLRENLRSGQALQQQYQRNPFSPLQQQAYRNQFANSDYFRSLSNSVMGQMNQQKPFDRNNPSARPQPFQMPAQPAQAPYGALPGAFNGQPSPTPAKWF